MSWGMGAAGLLVGALVLWAITEGGHEGKSKSTPVTTTQHVVRLLPEGVKGWLATIFAVLMLLMGLGFIVMGFVFLLRKKRGGG